MEQNLELRPTQMMSHKDQGNSMGTDSLFQQMILQQLDSYTPPPKYNLT
jgi:hypothetical protein